VSCFYTVNSKYSDSKEGTTNVYLNYFNNSMRINSSYVFFYEDYEILKSLQNIRNYENYVTDWEYHPIKDFHFHHLLNNSNNINNNFKWNETEMTELKLIWFEKIKMIYKASLMYKSEWYIWIDSGINTYRNYLPPQEWWPSYNLGEKYGNKFVIHNFRGRFAFAATSFAIHSSLVTTIYDLFYFNYHECVKNNENNYINDGKNKCDNEQAIFEIMYYKYPILFNNFPSIGLNWGAFVTENYSEEHEYDASGCRFWANGKENNCKS
jgi:hypothetical protein